MKFSMNGFRRQLSGDVETLRDIAADILKGEGYDEENFIDAVNSLITHSNVINCVYNNSDPMFTDMSGLEVEHLEQTA